ncbi:MULTISPECIES: DUF4870 domain-containing protein [unclassified Stenotrophomonas]|uniref:DUF4870 domain-containing protein n=1 Tax=unclassified Stenotrophomonas TaxID=196198 RepID=UPI0025D857B0|nr:MULTISPECIES: DUF4870 domain-containing protein [unclassified Stenotrophomonas]
MSDYQNTTPPPPPANAPASDDNTIAMLVHLSGIILGFIVPLIMWLVNKDKPEKAFLTENSKEALNFQLTLLGVYIIGTILTIILIGALINFAAWIACIVFSIIAGLAANKGETYRYPMTIRLIK